MDAQFRSLGSNLVLIMPGHSETAGAMPGVGGAPNDLTLEDARALQRHVRQAKLVVPVSIGTETVAPITPHHNRAWGVRILSQSERTPPPLTPIHPPIHVPTPRYSPTSPGLTPCARIIIGGTQKPIP